MINGKVTLHGSIKPSYPVLLKSPMQHVFCIIGFEFYQSFVGHLDEHWEEKNTADSFEFLL